MLQAFLNNRVKEFSTKKKLRFVYQILYRIAVLCQGETAKVLKDPAVVTAYLGE